MSSVSVPISSSPNNIFKAAFMALFAHIWWLHVIPWYTHTTWWMTLLSRMPFQCVLMYVQFPWGICSTRVLLVWPKYPIEQLNFRKDVFWLMVQMSHTFAWPCLCPEHHDSKCMWHKRLFSSLCTGSNKSNIGRGLGTAWLQRTHLNSGLTFSIYTLPTSTLHHHPIQPPS